MCRVQLAWYTVHCSLNTVLNTLYYVHCTLYTVNLYKLPWGVSCNVLTKPNLPLPPISPPCCCSVPAPGVRRNYQQFSSVIHAQKKIYIYIFPPCQPFQGQPVSQTNIAHKILQEKFEITLPTTFFNL